MEREILFRGKRVDNGEWVYGHYLKERTCDGVQHVIVNEDGEYYPINLKTRGEYTSLTNKNGRRIFEGDILRLGSGDYVVEWCNEHSKFLQVDKQFSRELYICIKESEVIGNVHDNPELLGGEI